MCTLLQAITHPTYRDNHAPRSGHDSAFVKLKKTLESPADDGTPKRAIYILNMRCYDYAVDTGTKTLNLHKVHDNRLKFAASFRFEQLEIDYSRGHILTFQPATQHPSSQRSRRTIAANVQAEHPRRLEVAKCPAQRRQSSVPQIVPPGQHRVQRRARLEEIRQLEAGCSRHVMSCCGGERLVRIGAKHSVFRAWVHEYTQQY